MTVASFGLCMLNNDELKQRYSQVVGDATSKDKERDQAQLQTKTKIPYVLWRKVNLGSGCGRIIEDEKVKKDGRMIVDCTTI